MFYFWARALHVCGVLLWFAGALVTLHVLQVQQRRLAAGAGDGTDFRALEGSAGRLLDAGAGVAIAAGLYLLFENPSLLKGAGFMHAKLTLVAVLLGLHGLLRAQLKRFRMGKSRALAGWAYPAVLGVFFAIVVLIVVKPL